MRRIIISLVALLASCIAMAQEPVEVILFGHRGSRFEFEENTMAAFKGSYEAGIRGFETDIRISKDGELVISHDASLERMTTSKGIVEEMTAKELRKVRTKKGEPLVFVDDMCKWLSKCDGMYIEFEMKSGSYSDELLKEYCDKLYKIAMKNKPANSTYLFTSFDKRTLRTMKELHPDADLMLIVGKPVADEHIAEAKALGVKRLACNIDGSSRTMVHKAKKEGLIISLWPGVSVENFMLGVALGADGLCCDCAVKVKAFAEKNMPWVKVK